jgi:hypothetical protein
MATVEWGVPNIWTCRLHDACQLIFCSTPTDPTLIQSVAQHSYFFFHEFKELKMFSITGHKDLKGFAVPGWQHTYVSQELTEE